MSGNTIYTVRDAQRPKSRLYGFLYQWLYKYVTVHTCSPVHRQMNGNACMNQRESERVKASLSLFFLKLALIISIQQSREIFIGLLMEIKISDSGVYVGAGLRYLSLDGQIHPINPLLGVNPVISQPPAFAVTLPSAHHCAWQLRKANLNGLHVRKELMVSIKKHLEI